MNVCVYAIDVRTSEDTLPYPSIGVNPDGATALS